MVFHPSGLSIPGPPILRIISADVLTDSNSAGGSLIELTLEQRAPGVSAQPPGYN